MTKENTELGFFGVFEPNIPQIGANYYSDYVCKQKIKPKVISEKALYGKFYVCHAHSIYIIPKLNFAP